jgi:hypothetical protein
MINAQTVTRQDAGANRLGARRYLPNAGLSIQPVPRQVGQDLVDDDFPGEYVNPLERPVPLHRMLLRRLSCGCVLSGRADFCFLLVTSDMTFVY